jgi:hypothetical protein
MANDLGQYAGGFADWRRMIATVPSVDAKATVFGNCAYDAAGYVARGLNKGAAVDELYDIAVTNGLIAARGEDMIQVAISDAFMRVEYEGTVLEAPAPHARGGNGAGPAPATPLPPLPPILSKAQFLNIYGKTPDYLIDDVLQKGFIYSLTGQTGHAKTAVALLLARLVSSSDRNAVLGTRKVGKGRVIYFVGENPDDVSLRIKGNDAVRPDVPEDDDISFVPGIFDIERMMSTLAVDMKRDGPASLIIVDTSAAYFLGNEELSNTQMGAYARVLRKLTTLPGNPCTLVLCHPVKHVTEPTQLLPRGGSAYLAEMDGNLTLWRTADDVVVLDYTKLRGPAFQPITFQLKPIRTPKLLDTKGRQITTIEATVISATEEDAVEHRDTEEEDRVLAAMLKAPEGSFSSWASDLGWLDRQNEPYKKRVERIINTRLAPAKPRLVTRVRKRWTLTEEGKAQARAAAQNFQREVEAGKQAALL